MQRLLQNRPDLFLSCKKMDYIPLVAMAYIVVKVVYPTQPSAPRRPTRPPPRSTGPPPRAAPEPAGPVDMCRRFKDQCLSGESATKCYRRLSMVYHPDKGGNTGDFQDLNNCRRVL